MEHAYREYKGKRRFQSETGHKDLKMLSRAVCQYREGRYTVTRYCETDIVVKHNNGSVTLSNGGFKTRSTLKHLNSFSRYTLRQVNWEWQVLINGEWVEFTDGMAILKDGTVRRG